MSWAVCLSVFGRFLTGMEVRVGKSPMLYKLADRHSILLALLRL